MRTWVSRQAALSLAAALCSSQTFMPPVKPTRPSQTTILRWLRKLTEPGRKRRARSGLNQATSAPAAKSGRRNDRRTADEPIESNKSRTWTPC